MDVLTLLDYLIRGLSLGSVYAIIALGYTMVYGIAKMLNFAHGDVFMVSGLIAIYLTTMGLPLPVTLALAVLITVLLGFLIERVAYKPLRSAPRMSVMISAIGVSYLLQNLATYITGGLPQMYPSLPGLSSQITIAGTSTKMVTVITPFLVVALVVVLTQLINHTKIGMAMRAASRDFETAQLMGIKINNVISFTFAVGSALAGIGSVLYCCSYPQATPTMGSMLGSILSATVLTILPEATRSFDSYRMVIYSLVLILMMIFRPGGLLGSYDFSMSRLVERVLFGKKKKEGADHE